MSEIVAAALAVMQRDGVTALTMRSLAAELGIHHTTLYTYAPHIEDVRREVISELATRIAADVTLPLHCEASSSRAHGVARGNRAVIQRHIMSR